MLVEEEAPGRGAPQGQGQRVGRERVRDVVADGLWGKRVDAIFRCVLLLLSVQSTGWGGHGCGCVCLVQSTGWLVGSAGCRHAGAVVVVVCVFFTSRTWAARSP